ncbi:arylesterase [Methylocystis sp. B8]|uniref:arylesterase n=1 Tax=Methylocystis sp. B8 TaxID=544938 RepID=UPI0010FE883C|nr:arylesterase [Methylocystis sp. B8]TLG79315.1 arylesterase [Methylocystis sp. B8]
MTKAPFTFSSKVAAFALLLSFLAPPALAQPINLLIFGDSLTNGFDLPEEQGFPQQLSRRLHADGYDVLVWNGSEPGDTSGNGYTRINQALQTNPDLVLVEFGANDMLDHTDPRVTYRYLDAIIRIFKARGARVILAGMLSLPKNGPNYIVGFNNIYPTLAQRQRVPLYPFMLAGVYGHPWLMQSDNEHPNALGTARMVAGIAPMIEASLQQIRVAHGGSRHGQEALARQ